MRIVLDTCVLYPTVMREMLLGAAREGFFTPVWSARILVEWIRAADKLGPEGAAQAEAEIALLRAAWPEAERQTDAGIEARIWLPDAADIHVLALAVSITAEAIMTLNAKDFPRRVLEAEGIARLDPDSYLLELWRGAPERIEAVAQRVLAEARRLSGDEWEMRPLLKKARLPRLGKALTRA